MSNNTINFKHAKDGRTQTCVGKTIFPALWPLAAVDVSTVMKVSENDISYDCPTDAEGLEQLISIGVDFLAQANAANLAISLITTAASDCEEVNESLSELAWLQVGLAELVSKTMTSIDLMQQVLKTKKPSN